MFRALIRRVRSFKGNDKCCILYDETGDPDGVRHGNCCSPAVTRYLHSWWYVIFVNCNWVVTRWQQYSTHLHTNNT